MGVPKGAEYSDDYELWGVGKTRGVGQWKWFTEEGVLVCIENRSAKGKRRRMRYFYAGTDIVHVDMRYDAKGRGTPTLYVEPELDWQKNFSSYINRDPSVFPPTTRRIEKVPNTYPLTYIAFDAEGRRLTRIGLAHDTKLIARLKKILKAKPGPDDLSRIVRALKAFLNELKADTPREIATALDRLAMPDDVSAKSYPKLRKTILEEHFGTEW